MQLLQRLTLPAVLICLAGCVQTKDCDWAEPIRPSANDVAVISDRLAEDLLVHNETGSRLCGWK